MSTYSGGIGPEEEDGAGWDGLLPSKAERDEEKAQHRRQIGDFSIPENRLPSALLAREAITKAAEAPSQTAEQLAENSEKINAVLHRLRNPWGHDPERVRQARLAAANMVEALRKIANYTPTSHIQPVLIAREVINAAIKDLLA